MFFKFLKKTILFLLFLVLLLGIVDFSLNNKPINLIHSLQNIEQTLANIPSFVNDFDKKISTPSPLIAKQEHPDSFLSRKGVIKWTNIQRDKNGSLPPLLEKGKLNKIAMERVDDMFLNQYFEHISPQGLGVSNIAKGNKYDFIFIGENIALGNFKNDETIVQAWMDSPGHRENIMNSRYQEIGVAVKKGTYEGKATWIGVQVFALPSSACPAPDQKIKSSIDIYKNQASDLENSANAIKSEIENANPGTRQEIILYNQKIDEHNNIVKEINLIFSKIKELSLEYNSQINAFNECIE